MKPSFYKALGLTAAGRMIPGRAPGMKKSTMTTMKRKRYKMVSNRPYKRRKKVGTYAKRSKTTKVFRPKQRKAICQIVHKCVAEDNPSGYWNEITVAQMPLPATNQQVIIEGACNSIYAGITGAEFNFCTIGQILDAASVLFNGKTSAQNYNLLPGNMSTQGLKLEVRYASQTQTIKNNSSLTVIYDIYTCVPKSSQPETFLQDIQGKFSALNLLSTPSGLTTYGLNLNSIDVSDKWTTKRKSVTLTPGQSYSWSDKKSPFVIDFDKLLGGGGLDQHQKFTVQYLITVRPSLNNSYTTAGTIAGYSGFYASTDSTQGQFLYRKVTKFVIEAPSLVTEANSKNAYHWKNYIEAQVGTYGGTTDRLPKTWQNTTNAQS